VGLALVTAKLPLCKNAPAQNLVLRWFAFKGSANASRSQLITTRRATDRSYLARAAGMPARGLAAPSRTIPHRALAHAAHKTVRA
jgi:hypothetical protein